MSPEIPQNETPQPPTTGRLSRKAVLLGLAAIVILALVSSVVLLASHKSGPKNQNSGAVYYDRPGFDRKNLSAGIGDPAILQMNATETAVQFQNTPAMQACNIVSPDDLRRNKVELYPSADVSGNTILRRSFMDGKSQEKLDEPLSVGLTRDDDLNNCQYQLYTGSHAIATLDVAVYQLFDADTGAFLSELQQYYDKRDPIESIQVYLKKPDPDSSVPRSEYILRSGKSASVHLTFSGAAAQLSQKDALLKVAALNLQSQLTHPTGPSLPRFESPVLKQKVVRACDIIQNEDLYQLTGQAAGPFIGEGLSTASGVLNFGGGASNNHAFVETDCTLSTPNGGSGIGADKPVAQTIDAVVRTFQSDQAARLYMQFARKDRNNQRPADLGKQLGDEAFAATYIVKSDNKIIFRKGRVVVELVLNKFHQLGDLRDQHKATQKLLPVAQKVAGRL